MDKTNRQQYMTYREEYCWLPTIYGSRLKRFNDGCKLAVIQAEAMWDSTSSAKPHKP
jgi:hypothetical protein